MAWLSPIVKMGAVVALLLAYLAQQGVFSNWSSRPFGATTDCSGAPSSTRVFSKNELSNFDGSDGSKPLLLCVLGELYDVSSGFQFYERNKTARFGVDSLGYNIFIGRDSSKAFASGNFTVPEEDVRGLTLKQVASVVHWRKFYREHKTYTFVGVVEGLYFDCRGQRSAVLDEVEAMEAKAVEAEAHDAALRETFKSCDSSYVVAEKASTIWCPQAADGKERYPRKFYWVSRADSTLSPAAKSEESMRCSCLSIDEEAKLKEELAQGLTSVRIERYEDCSSPTSVKCRIPVR